MADDWTQTSIFDLPLARQLRDEAINRVDEAANPVWKDAALNAVTHVARLRSHLTTDDVWQTMQDMQIPMPPEPRALGAIMQKAARLGLVTATDRIMQSARPECHARPVRVWTSLIANNADSDFGQEAHYG